MSIAVKIKKMWLGYRPGKIFSIMPDGQANALIRRGIAERVDVRPDPDAGAERRPDVRTSHAGRSKKDRPSAV